MSWLEKYSLYELSQKAVLFVLPGAVVHAWKLSEYWEPCTSHSFTSLAPQLKATTLSLLSSFLGSYLTVFCGWVWGRLLVRCRWVAKGRLHIVWSFSLFILEKAKYLSIFPLSWNWSITSFRSNKYKQILRVGKATIFGKAN